MGLFSNETKTYVDSTIFNLAGDANLRPNLVNSAVTGAILTNADIAVALQSTFLNGTGSLQRSYFQWCQTNYTEVGMPTASIGASQYVDNATVKAGLTPLLALAQDETLSMLDSVIDGADVTYWAGAWVAENRPELAIEAWSTDYDSVTQEVLIDITGEPVVRIPASADLIWGLEDLSRQFLFATYQVLTTDPDTNAQTAGPTQMYVYRMGSGNVTFDNLLDPETPLDEFFPALPLRLDNVPISDAAYAAIYSDVSAAYKKLTGQPVDEMLAEIEDNESIDDIDYCFLVHGVSLNCLDKTGQEYIYLFLKELMNQQTQDAATFATWRSLVDQSQAGRYEFDAWVNAQDNYAAPLYGTEPPDVPQAPPLPGQNELTVKAPNLDSFDYRIRWTYIDEQQFSGNGKTFDGDQARGKMKKGEYWFHVDGPVFTSADYPAFTSELGTVESLFSRIYLFHQYSDLQYRRLEIVGLEHHNHVYVGKYVELTAQEALEDEEESPFLLPLHYPTLLQMSAASRNQLATVNSYLVFNSYEQVTVKWWQKSFFKVILIIASVVFSVVTAGASLGTTVGILGSNAAVGAMFGATAATAALVGAVANAFAAMALSTALSWGAEKVFGEKLGAIIGTIAGLLAMNLAGTLAQTGELSLNLASIFNPENLLNLTNSATAAYTQWLQADTADIYEEIEVAAAEYEEQMKEIEEQAQELLGVTSGEIDPMILTDALSYSEESHSAFLQRTLLTGTDIADISRTLIEEFAEISLQLPMQLS